MFVIEGVCVFLCERVCVCLCYTVCICVYLFVCVGESEKRVCVRERNTKQKRANMVQDNCSQVEGVRPRTIRGDGHRGGYCDCRVLPRKTQCGFVVVSVPDTKGCGAGHQQRHVGAEGARTFCIVMFALFSLFCFISCFSLFWQVQRWRVADMLYEFDPEASARRSVHASWCF